MPAAFEEGYFKAKRPVRTLLRKACARRLLLLKYMRETEREREREVAASCSCSARIQTCWDMSDEQVGLPSRSMTSTPLEELPDSPLPSSFAHLPAPEEASRLYPRHSHGQRGVLMVHCEPRSRWQ